MDDNIDIRLVLATIATMFLFILTNLPPSHSQEGENKYTNCSRQPYNCGDMSNISYPFWGQNRPPYCGGGGPLDFKLECQKDNTTILIGPPNFHVLHINTTAYTIRMRQTVDDVCSPTFNGIYLDLNPTLFANHVTEYNITIFYNCSSLEFSAADRYEFTCGNENGTYGVGEKDDVLKEHPELQNCERHIQVPIQVPQNPYGDGFDALKRAFYGEFEVNYTNPHAQECIRCLDSNGTCGVKEISQFTCYCQDGSDAIDCHGRGSNKKLNSKTIIIIGVCSAVFVTLVASIAFYFYRRQKKNSYAKSYVQSQSFSSDPSLKDPERGSQYFGAHLFAYSELEEATNHFDSSRELGEGGFGTVYFGKLRDGRCVAVKRLYENNCRRVEQFINEVQILTRLVHPNLVSLYGCTSRHSRELLLVYEYIPNGTVADNLHGEQAKPGTLSWHTRMDIAVETASALNYLHVSGIIHRDVKTNNILLDNHFRVKVADFGLSRLFPNDLSHVSTAPQGTPGYVDPEYHECYQLTNKSDVYSFGVVLIELISSLPAVDITRHRHEINLSNMAINKIHNQALHELVDPTLGFESDYKVRKMINAVAELAFQCLQSSKDVRPSMEEVFNTLKYIQSDGKYKSQPEVMDISSSTENVVLLKDDPPPPSPDSNAVSKSTTPNASG